MLSLSNNLHYIYIPMGKKECIDYCPFSTICLGLCELLILFWILHVLCSARCKIRGISEAKANLELQFGKLNCKNAETI